MHFLKTNIGNLCESSPQSNPLCEFIKIATRSEYSDLHIVFRLDLNQT